MKTVPLTAYPRTLTRRPGAKRLRASGRVPAVMYGGHSKPMNLELVGHELETLIQHSVSENILLDLSVSDGTPTRRLALVQQIQHHPLSGHPLHVDLHEVSENEQVTIMVPVETVGEAIGVKTNGGILEHVLFKIKVRGLPKDVPEVITVDVSHLDIGQTLHLADIPTPPKVELVGDKSISVISVAAPITEAQEAAVLEAAAGPLSGEVEMIKEKKEEGAEGEAAAPGAKGAEKAPAAGKGAEKAPAGKGAAAPAAGAKAPAAGTKAPAAGAKAPAAAPAEKGAEKKGRK